MKLKKIIASSLALTLSLAAFTGCGNSNSGGVSADTAAAGGISDSSSDLRTLRVGIMTGQPDQYAVFIGTEEGIFEKYGVNVETNEYVMGINTVDAIVNGLEDTGNLADFAAVNRIGNTLKATNLVLFSELAFSTPATGGLFVAPEYADDLSKLDGSIGWLTQLGTVVEYYNWQAQTHIGVDPAAQTNIPIDSPQTGLALAQNGGAAAAVITGSNVHYYEGYGWTLAASAEDIGMKTGAYLVTTREFLADNTDLLGDYLKALNESLDYITNNLDSCAERAEAKFGVNAEDFKINWQSLNFEIGFTEEGAAHLDGINDWAFGEGRYDEAYNIRDFIDTSAAEKAAPGNVTINK